MRHVALDVVRLEGPQRRRFGYRARLIAAALAPLLIAMCCQAVYILRSDRELSTRALQAKATALSSLLSRLIGPGQPRATAQDERALEGLGLVASDPDFAFAAVVDARGELVAYRGDERLRAAASVHAARMHAARMHVAGAVATSEHVIARTPISTSVTSPDGRPPGAVLVALGFGSANARIATTTLYASLLAGAGVLAAVLAVVMLAGRVERRERETRLLLENVEQGFLSMSRAGVLAAERSAAAARWLGAYKPGQHLWEALEAIDPDVAAWIEVSWGAVQERLVPLDVALGQIPRQLTFGARSFRLGLIPARRGERLDEILVVLTDITDELARARAEAAELDLARLTEKIAQDLPGLIEFFGESRALVARISARDAGTDLETLVRDLHTLKGNSSVFGLQQIAQLCHLAEDKLAAGGIDYAAGAIVELAEAWQVADARFHRLASCIDPTLRGIDLDDLADLLAGVRRGASAGELQALVASWHLERVDARLRRFADQLRGLARRYGKGEVDVEIETAGLRLPTGALRAFWSTVPHLLRNIVDHGLEPADERRASGKPERGRVELRARQEDDRLVISVVDDGRGIDWERVAGRARSASLPAGTHDELVAALFADGVTTREEASELSGRGVGLAAVRVACKELDGVISVASTPGAGVRFSFSFPLSNAMRSAA